MSARSCGLCVVFALAGCLACACSAPAPSSSASEPQGRDFQVSIARLKRDDPNSPAVLSAQLGYAEFLLSKATGPCRERLEQAQEQVGSVDANPKTRVMFPDGWANVADLKYRLHLARAECSAPDRKNELNAAVEAARRAAELYRNVYDYHSMVIMQFDASVALHEIGEEAAARKSLEATLATDREYGFKDDAAENYKLLLTWRGKPAGVEQVDALMQDFPARQVTLKFGWHPAQAHVALENQRECLVDGQIVSTHGAAHFERHIERGAGAGAASDGGRHDGGTGQGGDSARDDGWTVSYSSRLNHYEPGVWPTKESSARPVMVFPPAPLVPAGFKVSATGEFDGVTDSEALAPQALAMTEQLIRGGAPSAPAPSAGAPSSDAAHNMLDDADDTAAANLSPGMLEAAAAEDYQLETAMWIGATLDQGVWYHIDAPLPLPGMPRVVVQSRIDFAFTRWVPCSAGASERSCIEVVMRTTPDKDALDRIVDDFTLPTADGHIDAYTATTAARMVTDPATLLPYEREERVYWYAALDKRRGNTLLQSEHRLSTTSYVER